jgi:hypothetical protein
MNVWWKIDLLLLVALVTGVIMIASLTFVLEGAMR